MLVVVFAEKVIDPRRVPASARSLARKDDGNRFDQYLQLLENGQIGDVLQVVEELVLHHVKGLGVAVFDLRESGDTRFHDQAKGEFRKVVFDLVDKEGSLRPWADDAHFSLDDIEKLRHLIDPCLSQEPAYTCDSRIVFTGQSGPGNFSIRPHRSELVYSERPAGLNACPPVLP